MWAGKRVVDPYFAKARFTMLKPYLDKAAELGVDVPVLQYVYGVAKVQDAGLAD